MVLINKLQEHLADDLLSVHEVLGECTITVAPQKWLAVATQLRDHPDLAFAQCVDLCGVDYQDFSQEGHGRFAVVIHLLSLQHNQRLRVRTFAADDGFPVVPSLMPVWNSVNWFEREAFDMFGLVFDGHSDLRRILTDYGFVGHPLRKDFPLSGHVEMRYDPEQKRVVYQPVSIEPREIVPRVVREESYGG